MQQLAKINQWLSGKRLGAEIGAFKSPLPGISPIYIDKFPYFGNERCTADFEGEAIALPFKSNSLEYVASSHVLEHVANPIKALVEWHRVLRPGGIIYMVVPDRRYTWDRYRTPTPVDHFFQDFTTGTSAIDGTHIDEFVSNLDWSTYSPTTPSERVAVEKEALRNAYWSAVREGKEINIHFHVFEPENLRALIESAGATPLVGVRWELVDLVEKFPAESPSGILAVIRVKKHFTDWLASLAPLAEEREQTLLPTAKKFA